MLLPCVMFCRTLHRSMDEGAAAEVIHVLPLDSIHQMLEEGTLYQATAAQDKHAQHMLQ